MRSFLSFCSPSFLDRAKIGIEQLMRRYPEAQLLEIQGFPVDRGFIRQPHDAHEIALVFSNMWIRPDDTVHQETLIIRSTGPRTFGQITVIPEPWIGVDTIRFSDIQMSLDEAINLKRKAGLIRPEDSVFVCKTVSFVNQDILYIFGSKPPFHIVNTRTKEVFEEIINFDHPILGANK